MAEKKKDINPLLVSASAEVTNILLSTLPSQTDSLASSLSNQETAIKEFVKPRGDVVL